MRLANPAYETLNKNFDELWNDYEVNGSPPGGPYVKDYPIREGERAVFVRAWYARWQLVEQLADFWHNHFNVYGYETYTRSVWSSWDRDVIRRNMLGNFRTMLQATFESPAMLYFLDNYLNRAPSFNENYAREVCELHTLGAINYLGPELQQSEVPLIPPGEDGAGMPVGYVDADVYEMARALTGWSFGDGQKEPTATAIRPWSARHDIGQKPSWCIRAGEYAAHPGDRDVSRSHRDASGNRASYRDETRTTLHRRRAAAGRCRQCGARVLHRAKRSGPIEADRARTAAVRRGAGSFRDIGNFAKKIQRPFESVVSALRATSIDFTLRRNIDGESNSSDNFMSRFIRTGERPFYWRAPNGYPDASDAWTGSTALVQSWRTMDWTFDEDTGTDQIPLVPLLDITLNEFSSDPNDHTPNNLANFWLTRVFGWVPDPTDGWRGTDLHTKVRDFMTRNTDTLTIFPPDVGIGAGPAGNTLGIETNQSPNYWYSRLRGMVNVIVFSPQFMVR